jgi:Rv0078B-related antitoxin
MGSDLTPVQKLHAAFDLFEAGVDLMRQNLKRRHPEATGEDLERMLREWLHTRPGAEHGDGPQEPVR